MKRKINSLIGFTIGATDGEIGTITDLYFDDKTWTIRYLIVETGSWLFGRKVMLSPQAMLTPDWDNKVLNVNLEKEQIKNSPNIDTDKPVSRQHETELYNHYPWGGYYWAGGMGMSGIGMSYPIALTQPAEMEDNAATSVDADADPQLRSTNAVVGYSIKANDGEIGEVEDFIFDDHTWIINFIEVNTGNWFPGKKVLLAPVMINKISWHTSLVTVNASIDQVKNSPEYIPDDELLDSYEANLQNYYGRFIKHN